MPSKKPEKLQIGDVVVEPTAESDVRVWLGIDDVRVWLDKESTLAVSDRLRECAEYKPEPWVPEPGELFRVCDKSTVYRRVGALYYSPFQLEYAAGRKTINTETHFAAIEEGTGAIHWFLFCGAYVLVEKNNDE